MSKQSRHVLREYHLLVVRSGVGFAWQIRYDRNARPFRVSDEVFETHAAAEAEGQRALAALKADLGEGLERPPEQA